MPTANSHASRLKPAAKVGLVVAGYFVALLIASGVVALYSAFNNGPDRQGGMAAFGDSLLFLGVFALASAPPTGIALFFLRPYRPFWRGLTVIVALIVATGVAASVIYLLTQTAPPASPLHRWGTVAVLRILVAPPLALAIFLSGLFAPERVFRIALLLAAAVEAAAFARIALRWFLGV